MTDYALALDLTVQVRNAVPADGYGPDIAVTGVLRSGRTELARVPLPAEVTEDYQGDRAMYALAARLLRKWLHVNRDDTLTSERED